MARADYTFTETKYELKIIDLDLGRTSVTNCIDEVIEEICRITKMNPDSYARIVYLDSEKRWDGYDYETKSFYPVEQENLNAEIA